MKKKLLLALALSASVVGVSAQQKSVEKEKTGDVIQKKVVESQEPIQSIRRNNAPSREISNADLNFLLRDIYNSIRELRKQINEVHAIIDPLVDLEYVDLGMTDKAGNPVYWATCNLGALRPEDCGQIFAWGETECRESDYEAGMIYDWAGYKWIQDGAPSTSDMYNYITKYTVEDNNTDGIWYDSNGMFIGDGKTRLEKEDDAAHVILGGAWRMPTQNELDWLLDNCNHVKNNGRGGYEFTSKITGKTLFLPWYEYTSCGGYMGKMQMAYYWSSDLDDWTMSESAMCLYFNKQNQEMELERMMRSMKLFIRPVCTVLKR